MDNFEKQFEDLDVQSEYVESVGLFCIHLFLGH